MKKIIFVLIGLFLLLGIRSGSAQPNLGMGSIGPLSYKDTVTVGTIDSFYVWVRNFAISSPFNDSLKIAGAVRDTVTPSTLHPLGIYNVGLKSIPADDSIFQEVVALYDITTNNYQAGINVIVIWPVAQSATTSVDSLEFTVFIIKSNGIDELNIKQLIKIYPNPVMDKMWIENKAPINVEEVRIYDVSGCLIEIIKGQSVINTEKWAPGMYLVDIWLENHQKQSIRVMKQK